MATEEQVNDFFDELVKDNKELYWSRKASRGDHIALWELANVYLFKQDFEKTLECFIKSAKQGNNTSADWACFIIKNNYVDVTPYHRKFFAEFSDTK